MKLTVKYVDGKTIQTTTDKWSELPADGIDYVDLDSYRMQGQSVYWLRQDGGLWVVGGGTVAQVQEAKALGKREYAFDKPKYMPDLTHKKVKLGWWLP